MNRSLMNAYKICSPIPNNSLSPNLFNSQVHSVILKMFTSQTMDQSLKWTLLLMCVLLVKAGKSQVDPQRQNEVEPDNDESSDNIKVLTRLINDCGEQADSSVCFKMKAVSFMERLIKAPSDVPITDYMALARDPSAPPPDNNTPTTEQELDATLPRSLEEKSRKLDDMLWNKFVTLLTTRKLQLSFPTEVIEGRGHKKGGGMKGKKGHMMMMMMMMKGMIMKMMMWGMAVMSWKGMMMAKMAMVMAGWMVMKKMAEHPPVVYGPPPEQPMGGGGGYYRRQQNDAQNMAYGGSHTTVDY